MVVAAADTLRAAAEEQLEIWAERSGADFVGSTRGGDPAAVAFDAIEAAEARGRDVVIVDTSRSAPHADEPDGGAREDPARDRAALEGAPHETLLVVDATTGQNGLRQAGSSARRSRSRASRSTKLDGARRAASWSRSPTSSACR